MCWVECSRPVRLHSHDVALARMMTEGEGAERHRGIDTGGVERCRWIARVQVVIAANESDR